MKLKFGLLATAIGCTTALFAATASASTTLTVCGHGCKYRTIQSAVNATGPGATIKVKPGTYVEGVVVSGHKHDGLHILGQGLTPSGVFCTTGAWTVGATRVLVSGQPVAVQAGVSVCVAPGTPFVPVAVQPRVVAT